MFFATFFDSASSHENRFCKVRHVRIVCYLYIKLMIFKFRVFLQNAKKLEISVDTGKGYRALANISEHGGQEVPHLHFHLFGGERVGKMVE